MVYDKHKLWGFPGGKIKRGELWKPALLREWFEEIGKPFPKCNSFKPILTGNCISVSATIEKWEYEIRGSPGKWDSVSIWRWFSLAELDNLSLYSYVKEDLIKHGILKK